MANNGRIKLLRANSSQLNSTKKLVAGQPLYITDKNYLTIGNLNDDNKSVNAQPVDARRIHGYTSDNSGIGNATTGEYKVESYITDDNKSGLLIKAPDEIKLEADKVSATEFTGNLKGNVTGNVAGNAASASDYSPLGTIKSSFQAINQWIQIYQHIYDVGEQGGNIDLVDLHKTSRETIATDCDLIKIIITEESSSATQRIIYSIDMAASDFISDSFRAVFSGSVGYNTVTDSSAHLAMKQFHITASIDAAYFSLYNVDFTASSSITTEFVNKTYLTIYGYKNKTIVN